MDQFSPSILDWGRDEARRLATHIDTLLTHAEGIWGICFVFVVDVVVVIKTNESLYSIVKKTMQDDHWDLEGE